MKLDQDKKKSYAGRYLINKEFQIVEHAFLKVKENNTSVILGRRSKLAVRYHGLFGILNRIGDISYRLALSTCMHVHDVFLVYLLKNYVTTTNHVID